RTALLPRTQPPDVVDDVALDDEVVVVRIYADDAFTAVGAHTPDVVDMVLRHEDVVAPLGIDAVARCVAHLEAVDPDVRAVDLEARGGGVALPVDHRPPAVRALEHEPGRGCPAAPDRDHVVGARVHAIVDDRHCRIAARPGDDPAREHVARDVLGYRRHLHGLADRRAHGRGAHADDGHPLRGRRLHHVFRTAAAQHGEQANAVTCANAWHD